VERQTAKGFALRFWRATDPEVQRLRGYSQNANGRWRGGAEVQRLRGYTQNGRWRGGAEADAWSPLAVTAT